MDALAQRQYYELIHRCREAAAEHQGNALEKLGLILAVYKSTAVDASIDKILHQPQNAAIHQKSLADIVINLSPIIADIFRQGIQEGIFHCEYPEAYAEVTVSTLAFLLDPGIFTWSEEQYKNKLVGLADILEKGLGAKAGTFSFLHQNWRSQKLT